jgi:hypothetical protein
VQAPSNLLLQSSTEAVRGQTHSNLLEHGFAEAGRVPIQLNMLDQDSILAWNA